MMQNSKHSSESSSIVSKQSSVSAKPKSKVTPPDLSEYEYVGRLVTREAPAIRKSKSLHKNIVFPSNTKQYRYSTKSHHREDLGSSDNIDEDLSKPLGVIKINDRHSREIYRVPTPPPQVKRVFHRLKSPKPDTIERIFVRRPTPEIIENIVEVPPRKVRIINREKILSKSKPIVRTKYIYLQPERGHTTEVQQRAFIPSDQYSQRRQYQQQDHGHTAEVQQRAFIPSDQYSQQQQQQQIFIPSDQYSQQQEQTFISSDQYSQQQQPTFIPSDQYSQQQATSFAYPSIPYVPMNGHIQSTIPSYPPFDVQQYINQHIPGATSYSYEPPGTGCMSPRGYSQY